MLLLRYAEDQASSLSDEEVTTLLLAIRAWYHDVRQKNEIYPVGRLKTGEGRVVRSIDGRPSMDGPFTESKEALAGIFIVVAEDYDTAASLASGCPMVAAGGSIEVRAIDRGPQAPPLSFLAH